LPLFYDSILFISPPKILPGFVITNKKIDLHMGIKVQQKQQTITPFGKISFINDEFTPGRAIEFKSKWKVFVFM
jgi:hypothetical protein